jgi:hypothetical protein
VTRISSFIVLAAILGATSSSKPFALEEITLSDVARAGKAYFRDSAEFPMHISTGLTATDLSGRVRKHKSATFKYDFHGYNQRSANGTVTLHGPRAMMKAAFGAVTSSMAPVSFLSPSAEKKYAFKVTEQGVDVVSARLSHLGKCEPSRWLPDFDALNPMCGSFEVQLQRDDLALKRYIFDAANLPVQANIDPFGAATISTYHAEVEFQKVFLPDDPKPFLIPRLVIVIIETDKGKLVIRSNYVPDSPQQK